MEKKLIYETEFVSVYKEIRKGKDLETLKIFIYNKQKKCRTTISIHSFYEEHIKGLGIETYQ